MILWKRDH